MNIISVVAYFFSSHQFVFFFVGIVGSIIVFSLAKEIGNKIIRNTTIISVIFFLCYTILNFIWGSDISGALINKYGKKTSAVITDIEHTNSNYNDVPVMKYHVMYRTADNKIIKSHFTTTSFNIYPTPEDGYQYPEKGIEFTIKYIPNSEDTFIILANDLTSAYGKKLKCDGVYKSVRKAEEEYQFAKSNVTFKKNYAAAIRLYLANSYNAALADHYKKELQTIEKE